MSNFSFSGHGAAKKFMPHEFANKVEILHDLPKVLLTRQAYEDMYCLVEIVQKEVGWLGSVQKIGNNFLIKEVFLFDQESHATTCEITPDGLAEFASEILATRADGMEVANSLRFWGHSHVNMATSPSGQDENQMFELANSCGDYFIRGILNKAGRMEFSLVLVEVGVIIRDVEWELYEPAENSRLLKWQREVDQKVREKVYQAPIQNHNYYGGGKGGKK